MSLQPQSRGERALQASLTTLETDAPRILIVRLSAIGDVVHGLPVLCALRDALPDAWIGWVVEGRAGDVLEGHPALNELIRVPRGWLMSPRLAWQVRRQLREARFDTTIDLQCLTKSAVAAWLSSAPRRIGKAGTHGRELSKMFHNELVEAGGQHVIDHYLELLHPLGIESPAVRFDVPQRERDAHAIDTWLQANELATRDFALLNPGAGWPSKIWPADRYGAVAEHLAGTHGLSSVVVWAGDAERVLGVTIVETSGARDSAATPVERAAVLAPATSIAELATLARRARLFVGSDTGPMHLAVAVGTPTISLHGPSRADWCGAYGTRNIRLQVRYDDGSARHRRTTDDSAMRAITSDMVCAACDQILAHQPTPNPGWT